MTQSPFVEAVDENAIHRNNELTGTLETHDAAGEWICTVMLLPVSGNGLSVDTLSQFKVRSNLLGQCASYRL